MSNMQFQPVTEMKTLVPRKYAFKVQSKDEALVWQQNFRQELSDLLGFLDTEKVDPESQLIEEVDQGDYIQQKVVIKTSTHAAMPVYILIPKGVSGKIPTVLAYHGHGPGVIGILHDWAARLCQEGFCVVAPEIAGFGERTQTGLEKPGTKAAASCHHMATYAMMIGKSAVGYRVRDSLRLVDYLANLPFVDIENLGVVGFSGGGTLAFFHSCVDERLKAVVVSGYFCGFEKNILPIGHCICNHIPNLLTLGDHQDLVGLIIPRPLFIEAGSDDNIFLIEFVKDSVAKAREISSIFGCAPDESVEFDEIENAGHEFSGRRSFTFLKKHLGLL